MSSSPSSLLSLLTITVCHVGIQFTWTVEFGYGTAYLLSLGMSKELTALVWLAGPLSGLLVQPVIGMLSDQSTLRWGRRRPFMFVGAVSLILSMLGICFAKDLTSSSPATIAMAVASFYLLDFSINAVQASARALIVDTVPHTNQNNANAWASRMLAIGAVLGYTAGYLDLVSLLGSSQSQLTYLSFICITIFTTTLAITLIFTKESTPNHNSASTSASASSYSFMSSMSQLCCKLWTTWQYLPAPITSVLKTQLLAWFAWFPFLFYATPWITSKIDTQFEGKGMSTSSPSSNRYGSLALLLFSLCQFAAGFTIPFIVSHHRYFFFSSATTSSSTSVNQLTLLPRIWAISLWFFAGCMASTFWVESVEAAVIVVAACGASFGVAVWVPFSLIGEAIAFYGSGGGDGGVSFAKLGGSGSIHSSSSSSSSTSTIAVEDEYSIFISNNGNGIDDDNDEEDDDDLLISQHANLYGNPRSSFPTIEAGTVLGIHNIAIVLPQFAGTLVCSLVFSMVGWFQQVNGYSEKQADAFGWVLRVCAVAAVMGGFVALKVQRIGGVRRDRVD